MGVVRVVGRGGFPRRLACASMTYRSCSALSVDRLLLVVVGQSPVGFAIGSAGPLRSMLLLCT